MNQQDGVWAARPAHSDAPIYDRLVAERGDPAEVNRTAAQIFHESGQAMDFGSIRALPI
ncbi:hypothetical protein ABZ471_39330 [Streptomyces sp. NPDC005728]|uniref:hypothetical protein n=1 Tax=Streptomyces sp. NPDC005728 TaxID=3157054 RepID=UPI00340B9781